MRLPDGRLSRERIARIGERGISQLVHEVAGDRVRIATVDRYGQQLGARAVRPAALVAQVRHPLSIRRKDRRARLATMTSQPPRSTARAGYDPHVVEQAQVAIPFSV